MQIGGQVKLQGDNGAARLRAPRTPQSLVQGLKWWFYLIPASYREEGRKIQLRARRVLQHTRQGLEALKWEV